MNNRYLLAMVVCLSTLAGGCRGRQPAHIELFEKSNDVMAKCVKHIESNGGKIPDDEHWRENMAKLSQLHLVICRSVKPPFVFFEILTPPLDIYEAFVYVPSSYEFDDAIHDPEFSYHRIVEKEKLAGNWYWFSYD
jgi:hypothetical protein